MTRKSITFIISFMLIIACTYCLKAEGKIDEAAKVINGKNIQIGMMIVISEKGKADIKYNYEIEIQQGRYMDFNVGNSKPDSLNDQQTKQNKSNRYVNEGISGSFFTLGDEKKIVLNSKLKFSQVILNNEVKESLPRTFSIDTWSLHENSQFIKVFSGNFVDPKQSVTVSIKADSGNK
jgi:hypothetical protein